MATTTLGYDGRRTRVLVGCLVLAGWGCGTSKVCPPSGGSGAAGGGTGGAGTGGVGGAPVTQKLVILHTNDLHSHLMGFSPELDYTPATLSDDATHGGMARVMTAIGTARAAAVAANEPVLLLDAGDFMMGTLFELLATSAAPELQLMQAAGYDATTIGNHELDWTPAALAGILQAAKTAGVTVPIVASNMKFSDTDARDDSLNAFFGVAGMIRPKLIKTVGGIKVGIFGLLGKDAVQVTPQAAPLMFDPIAAAAQRMVTELRTVDKVDLVIALSHSGISSTGTGEDAVLAAAVNGIDVIVSGHTHDSLSQPAKVNNTLIVTAGSYGEYLGNLELSVTPAATAGGSPTVNVSSYTLQTIDDSIAGNATTQTAVDAYIAGIDTALAPALSYKKVVGSTTMDLKLTGRSESPLGDLVTDAYRTIATQLEPPADPPLIAFEGNGQIRADLLKGATGAIWLADLFRVTPLGIGPDGKPGASLVTFYLNAKDIKSGLELGGADGVDPQYFLQLSGLQVEYDMTKPSFGRVSSMKLVDATNTVTATLDPTNLTTCYKIVSTNFVSGLLGVVANLTGNLLSVQAKAKDCVTLVDPTTRFVDADPTTPATAEELKQWQAVLTYFSGFPDTNSDQIPEVPAVYGATQGRITFK
jgi:5'-nucleotidase/UDP-sugar diphosphatase